MKCKKGDLLMLWYVLENLKHKKQNVKFSYFVAKNKLAIKGEVDSLNEANEASEVFQLYDTKRAELASTLADRVPSTDQPMTANGQYVIKENKDQFDKELDKLKKEFKTAIGERETQLTEFRALLEEEVEFKGHAIKLDDLPQDVEPSTMEVLLSTDLILE